MLRDNVGSKVDPPLVEYVERPAITPCSAANLLRAARGTELFAVIAAAIATGARRSELCALRRNDPDLNEGTIAIRRRAANVDKRVILGETKTKNSRRTFPRSSSHFLRNTSRRNALGYVFTTPTGELWDPNELSRQFARFIRRHELPDFRFHDLRHGFASLAFAAGVPLAVVSKSLGHASISITANVYTHLLTDQKREKAAALDAYLGAALKARYSV